MGRRGNSSGRYDWDGRPREAGHRIASRQHLIDRRRCDRAEPGWGTLSSSPTNRRARGEIRRRRLLSAVLAIVSRDGVGAVTHRRVAAEAGLPLAATTYYFATREALLAEALEQLVSEDIAQLTRDTPAYLADPLTPATLAARLTASVSEWLHGDRSTLLTQYEISLQSVRQPDLAAALRSWTQAYILAFAPALERLGSDDPQRDSWIVLSAVGGMVLDERAAPEPDFASLVLLPALERLIGRLTSVGSGSAEIRTCVSDV